MRPVHLILVGAEAHATMDAIGQDHPDSGLTVNQVLDVNDGDCTPGERMLMDEMLGDQASFATNWRLFTDLLRDPRGLADKFTRYPNRPIVLLNIVESAIWAAHWQKYAGTYDRFPDGNRIYAGMLGSIVGAVRDAIRAEFYNTGHNPLFCLYGLGQIIPNHVSGVGTEAQVSEGLDQYERLFGWPDGALRSLKAIRTPHCYAPNPHMIPKHMHDWVYRTSRGVGGAVTLGLRYSDPVHDRTFIPRPLIDAALKGAVGHDDTLLLWGRCGAGEGDDVRRVIREDWVPALKERR